MKKGQMSLKTTVGIILAISVIFASIWLVAYFMGPLVGNADEQATTQSFDRFVETVNLVGASKEGDSLKAPISIGKSYQIIAWPKSESLVVEECGFDDPAQKPIKCGSRGCICLYELTLGYSGQGQDITEKPNSPIGQCVYFDFDIYGLSGDSYNNGASKGILKYAVFTGDLCGFTKNFGTRLLTFEKKNGKVLVYYKDMKTTSSVSTPSPSNVAPVCFSTQPKVGDSYNLVDHIIDLNSDYIYVSNDANAANGRAIPYSVGSCNSATPDYQYTQPKVEVGPSGEIIRG